MELCLTCVHEDGAGYNWHHPDQNLLRNIYKRIKSTALYKFNFLDRHYTLVSSTCVTVQTLHGDGSTFGARIEALSKDLRFKINSVSEAKKNNE